MGFLWDLNEVSASQCSEQDGLSSTQWVELITPIDDDGGQAVMPYYRKTPVGLDETQTTYRVLNELIASQIARIILKQYSANKRQLGLPSYLVIPEFECIFTTDENGVYQVAGVASSQLSYDGIQEKDTYFTSKTAIPALKNMIDKGVGVIQALRLFLGDPDGANNIGFSPANTTQALAVIDFGLANYFELKARGALTEDEQFRLPDDVDTALLGINPTNLLLGFLPRHAKDSESAYLETTLHVVTPEIKHQTDRKDAHGRPIMETINPFNALSKDNLLRLCQDFYTTFDLILTCFSDESRLAATLLADLATSEKGTIAIANIYQTDSAFKALYDEICGAYAVKIKTLREQLKMTFNEAAFLDALNKVEGLPTILTDDLTEPSSHVNDQPMIALIAEAYRTRNQLVVPVSDVADLPMPSSIRSALTQTLLSQPRSKPNPDQHDDVVSEVTIQREIQLDISP